VHPVHVFSLLHTGVVPPQAPIMSAVHATHTFVVGSQIGFAAFVQSSAVMQPCGASASASSRQLSSGFPGQ